MASAEIVIWFYLDGKLFSSRIWHQVPRVGDEMMLQPIVQAHPKILTAYRVIRVIWGVEEDNSLRQAVNVEIEKILE